LNILVIPTTDWIGHPIPTRLHHIFERIAKRHTVHVLNFRLYCAKALETNVILHEINDIRSQNLALYYILNAHKHFSAVHKILKENQIDVITISNLLPGYLTAKTVGNKVRMVFDLSDHFPSSGAGYYFDMNSSLWRIAIFSLEQLLKATLKQMDCTVTCSHTLSTYANTLGARNVSMIPNGVDDFFLDAHNGKRVREKLGISKHLVIGYIGSIEFWLNMFPLLEAIKILSKSFDIKLMLLGTKPRTKYAQHIDHMIDKLKVEKNIIWLNFVPYKDVPKYIDAMDICTIPFNGKHPTAFYSAPIKLIEYFALGKPVISTPVPNVLSVAGSCVDMANTSDDYVRIIEDYIHDPKPYRCKGRLGKEIAKQLTWSNLARSYEQILKTSIGSNS
jgi:glycosyltransferase involved in cell wall biosynthesis